MLTNVPICDTNRGFIWRYWRKLWEISVKIPVSMPRFDYGSSWTRSWNVVLSIAMFGCLHSEWITVKLFPDHPEGILVPLCDGKCEQPSSCGWESPRRSATRHDTKNGILFRGASGKTAVMTTRGMLPHSCEQIFETDVESFSYENVSRNNEMDY
jgi:hypothetical protein